MNQIITFMTVYFRQIVAAAILFLIISCAHCQPKDSVKKDTIIVLKLSTKEYDFLMQKLSEAAQYEAQINADKNASQWQQYFKSKMIPNKEQPKK